MARGNASTNQSFPAALLAACLLLAGAAAAPAQSLSESDALRLFPGAGQGAVLIRRPGPPPAIELRKDGAVLGFAFSTRDAIGSAGYSGKALDIHVGLSAEGVVSGARLASHGEPILIVGIPPERLERFVSGFAGYDVRESPAPGEGGLPEAVAGASVSSAVIADAIARAARAVASSHGLLAESAGADSRRIERSSFSPATWSELLEDGSVARRAVSNAQLARALPEAAMAERERADPGALFIELFAALATPPGVGRNLLGRREFDRLAAEAGPRDSLILLAADGRYSFKGSAYRRSGLFERIQIAQGPRTFRLTRRGYRNVEALAAKGAPPLREIGAFILPGDSGFDPLARWRAELFVTRETEAGGALSAAFALEYELPGRHVAGASAGSAAGGPGAELAGAGRGAGEEPLWRSIWRERRIEIAALALVLLALTALLVLQDAVARNRRLYRALRFAFLGVTLVWIGWIAGAQLSVVNVIAFAQSLMSGFSWELFLLDPLSFMLWGFTAAALLFWGRGVFCGWLCPFGALQELLNAGARRLGVRQIRIPFALHERLWPIKYVIFLALFAVSLGSAELAFRGAEIEPFKTAISLKFAREWPFVLFAASLLFAGLFVERFYCRYLCPLGAALAIPARLRMFEWLKRRRQCGTECRTCESRCMVQAIHPDGAINPNECIHCLGCQANHYDGSLCPPLILKERNRLERARAAAKAREAARARAQGAAR